MRYEQRRVTVAAAVAESARRSHAALAEVERMSTRLNAVAEQWKNATCYQRAGRLAEEWHSGTFNIDAASKGLGIRATTGAASGAPTAPSDLTVVDPFGMPIAGRSLAQCKYLAQPARTAYAVSRSAYRGQQRIVPADQVANVRRLAEQRAARTRELHDYRDAADCASDRLTAQGAESQPLSRPAATELARAPSAAASELFWGQVGVTLKRGAQVGGVVSGGLAAVSNVRAYVDGRKSGGQAIRDTAVSTAAGAATGAAMGGATLITRAALLRIGASAAARSTAPVALALTAVELGKDLARAANGDLGGGEFVGRAAGHVVKGGFTWGGMEAGVALGTGLCPGIGTIVGGLLGGILGGLFGAALIDGRVGRRRS